MVSSQNPAIHELKFPSDCTRREFTFVISEYFFQNLPSAIFLWTGIHDFIEIRPLGFNRIYKPSCVFRSKSNLLLFLSIIVFLNILYQCLDYSHWKYLTSDQLAHDMVEDKKKHRNVIQRCVFGIQDPKNKSSDEITYDFVYLELHLLGLLRTISWYGSYKLMVYTYRKGLSEQFYS